MQALSVRIGGGRGGQNVCGAVLMTLPVWHNDWEKPDPLRGKRG